MQVINDLIFKVVLSITSLSLTLLSFSLMLQFRKSKQFIAWALIFISFLLHFTSDILYIQSIISSGGVSNVPYPSYRDYLWIISYVLFGLGVACYWLIINKSMMKSPIDSLIVISTLTFIVLITSLFLASNDLLRHPLDVAYAATASLMGFSCIPLITLFKKGLMAKQWSLIGLRGVFILTAQLIFLIETSVSTGNNFTNITYLIGDLIALIGFVKLLSF